MKRTIDTIKKTVSIYLEEKDEDISLDGLSEYAADGYDFRFFDAKGKEIYRNSTFKVISTASSNSSTTPQ